jgi:hypothetical protein
VGSVVYLVIRNEPFADPNLVVAARILLSLAVATLGATVPGFLQIGWNRAGLAMRAGGALGLFVLTYWLTPTVLPSLDNQRIPPLTDAKRVSVLPPQRGTSSPAVANPVLENSANSLVLRAVYEGDGEPQRKNFDIILSNPGWEQRIVSSFEVRWLYVKGPGRSVEQGVAIKPVEKYSIALQIDTRAAARLRERSIDVYPPIVLPPRNQSGPSITSIRIELIYTFENNFHYHPNTPWDIFYEIRIKDDQGEEVLVLSRSWNEGDAADWVAHYQSEGSLPGYQLQ